MGGAAPQFYLRVWRLHTGIMIRSSNIEVARATTTSDHQLPPGGIHIAALNRFPVIAG